MNSLINLCANFIVTIDAHGNYRAMYQAGQLIFEERIPHHCSLFPLIVSYITW